MHGWLTKQRLITSYELAVAIVCFFFVWGKPLNAEAESLDEFSEGIDSEYPFQFASALVVDQTTGQVLYAHEPDQQQAIASLTKVLTLDLVYDRIDAGALSLDTKVPINEDVAALSVADGLSNIPLEASEDFYTVDQLINAAMIASGNAAVVALAEAVAGSETSFVDELTHHLGDMGLSKFQLVTATGLSSDYAEAEDGLFSDAQLNEMSARDYLRAVRQILGRHPEIMERSLPTSLTLNGPSGVSHTVKNQNELIPGMAFGQANITGGKTGTQSEDNHSVFVRAQIADRPVLAVVMGDGADPLRYQDMQELLALVGEKLQWHAIHNAGEKVGGAEGTVFVPQGTKQYTALYYDQTVGYFEPVDAPSDDEAFQIYYQGAVNYDNEGNLMVKAPLTEGEPVNDISYVPDTPYFEPLDKQSQIATRVLATETIDKVPFLVRVTRTLNDMLQTFLHPEKAGSDAY